MTFLAPSASHFKKRRKKQKLRRQTRPPNPPPPLTWLLLTLRDWMKLSLTTSFSSALVRSLDFKRKKLQTDFPSGNVLLPLPAEEKANCRTVLFPDTCSDGIWGIRKDCVPGHLLRLLTTTWILSLGPKTPHFPVSHEAASAEDLGQVTGCTKFLYIDRRKTETCCERCSPWIFSSLLPRCLIAWPLWVTGLMTVGGHLLGNDSRLCHGNKGDNSSIKEKIYMRAVFSPMFCSKSRRCCTNPGGDQKYPKGCIQEYKAERRPERKKGRHSSSGRLAWCRRARDRSWGELLAAGEGQIGRRDRLEPGAKPREAELRPKVVGGRKKGVAGTGSILITSTGLGRVERAEVADAVVGVTKQTFSWLALVLGSQPAVKHLLQVSESGAAPRDSHLDKRALVLRKSHCSINHGTGY